MMRDGTETCETHHGNEYTSPMRTMSGLRCLASDMSHVSYLHHVDEVQAGGGIIA